MQANFECMERNVCFVGHSHVPAVYYQDGRIDQPNGTEGPYDLGFGPVRAPRLPAARSTAKRTCRAACRET